MRSYDLRLAHMLRGPFASLIQWLLEDLKNQNEREKERERLKKGGELENGRLNKKVNLEFFFASPIRGFLNVTSARRSQVIYKDKQANSRLS